MTQKKAGLPLEAHPPQPTSQTRSAHPGINLSNRTFRQSWMALPTSTRLKFSVAMMALATVGIFATDYLEEKLAVPPNNAQKST